MINSAKRELVVRITGEDIVMQSLLLVPLAGRGNPTSARATPLEIDAAASNVSTFMLSLDLEAHLHATPAPLPPHSYTNREERPLALLHAGPRGAWSIVPLGDELAINAQPPFPVQRLDLGMLMTVGTLAWMVCGLVQPRPVAAPKEVADKPCPVCGAPLALVTVVQCPNCLRWTHLERPDDPQAKDALNCYVTASTCSCGRAATLEPQVIPEPPAKLLAADEHEEWDEAAA